jgi:ribosome-binding factor A
MSERDARPRRDFDVMEDGAALFDGGATDARAERKTKQVCKEVLRTLAYALGASGDEEVRDMVVVAVEPAPDAARLMVTICAPRSTPADLPRLVARLVGLRGPLRAEIAAALQRKRTPELAFRVAPTAPHSDP